MTSSQSVQFLPLFLLLVLVYFLFFLFFSDKRKKGGWLNVSKSRRCCGCTLVAVKCSLTSDAKRSFPLIINQSHSRKRNSNLQLTFPKHTRFIDISFPVLGDSGCFLLNHYLLHVPTYLQLAS